MTRALSFLLGLLLLASGVQAQDLQTAPILRLDADMHTGEIRRIDVDAAERILVTGSWDKTVRVWSLEDGRLLQTLRVPAGEDDVGKVEAVAISPDGVTVAAGGWGPFVFDKSVYIFERRTGRLTQRIDGLPDIVDHLAFSQDGQHLAVTLRTKGIRVFNTADFSLVAAHTDYGSRSPWAAFDAAERLVTTSWDGQIRLYDADFDLITSVEAPGGARPFGVAFSPDGEHIAVGYADSTRVDVLDGATLAPRFEADTSGVDNGNLASVAWSADGRFLYAGGIYDDPDGSNVMRRWTDAGRGAYEDFALSDNTIMDLRPLADGRLAFGVQDPAFGLLAADGSILWRQNPTKADYRDQFDVFALSQDGRSVRFGFEPRGQTEAQFDLLTRRLSLGIVGGHDWRLARSEASALEVNDWRNQYNPTLNGEPLSLKPYEFSRSLAIAPDGERFLLGADWTLRCFDRAGDELWSKPAPSHAWAVNISGDGRLAIAAYGDGTIRWYRLEDGEELLAFYPDRGTAEEISEDNLRWVAWTPQGYYMASPGGEDLIGWHINNGLDTPEFFSASRFRDRFNRPDIVELVLEELDVEKAVARANEEANVDVALAPVVESVEELTEALPPVIQIIEPADGTHFASDYARVTYVVRAQGSTPPMIKALLNDQFVRGVTLPDSLAGEVADRMEIPLAGKLSARDAVITLIAEDEHGASDPARVTIKWDGGQVVQDKPRLFVLAVGVSQFRDHPRINLEYAGKDAADIVRALKGQEGGLYREVHALSLIDEDATAAEIASGFRWLLKEVDEGDVAMVFFSGHGAEDTLGYYFLPHDVDITTNDLMSVSAIGEQRIRLSLHAAYKRGAKVFAFFDTCYSGDVIGGQRALPPDIDRVAADLAAAENGVMVFTSSTGRELSKEDPSWGNGAFTKALLDAFTGKADSSGNGYVSVSELKGYLREAVRQLNRDQTPTFRAPSETIIEADILVVQ